MEVQNRTTGFIILGFSGNLEMRSLLFVLFLIMYATSLLGNTLISIVVRLDPTLHSPMCYLIASLSFVDICYTSVTAPKMLMNFLSKDKTISFTGCAAQLYFLLSLGTTECFLLSAMAYDRFLAICNPLRYSSIMSKQLCAWLVAGSWASGMMLSLGQTSLIFVLPFCRDNRVNYFFCDIPPLLRLACGDISLNEITVFMAGMLITLIPSLLILGSYVHIIATILKIASAKGRQKAFSTCSSHLIVITLFYGSASAMYLRPRSSYVLENDKYLALLYSVITPTLNPLIYSLRSKEINQALKRKVISKWFLFKIWWNVEIKNVYGHPLCNRNGCRLRWEYKKKCKINYVQLWFQKTTIKTERKNTKDNGWRLDRPSSRSVNKKIYGRERNYKFIVTGNGLVCICITWFSIFDSWQLNIWTNCIKYFVYDFGNMKVLSGWWSTHTSKLSLDIPFINLWIGMTELVPQCVRISWYWKIEISFMTCMTNELR